jgi:Flp/Fap pilin component
VIDPKAKSKQEAVLKRILFSFLSDESGATAIEYGLIAAGNLAGHHRGG